MLQLTSVTQRYGGFTALDGISLGVARGEFFGLLGPNGAGKSTLMSVVAGLRHPAAGEVRIDGAPAASGRAALGFVPQTIALYDDLSADQNLRIFGALHGLRGRELRARIDESLAAVQLTDRRRDAVKTFSGGMQRRLNLVAALLHRPRLLLCDEPTVGVDPQSRLAIFELLERLNRDGLTIIYSTHYMEEATRLCRRIAVIDHGRIIACGSRDELLAALPFTAAISFPCDSAHPAFTAELARHGQLTTGEGLHRFGPRPAFQLSAFYALAERHGIAPRAFTHERPTLEALFLHLTGRTLRE